jgi:hypothetical protein
LEFLVIVVGILSAFWVEEYREIRNSTADEAIYLARLEADLEGGTEAMTRGITWVDSRRADGRAVLSYLESGTSDRHPADLVIASFEVSLVPVSAQRRLGDRSTYDELLSTGNLTVLEDVEVRDALARYYLEFDRIGGRLLQIPEDYRQRSAGLLDPDLAEQLEAIDPTCRTRAGTGPDGCGIEIDEPDQQRFLQGLMADRDEAWRELTRLIQYQDRQAQDLRAFLARTSGLKRLLEGG